MRSFKRWKMIPSKPNLAATFTIAVLAVFATGCSGSVDEALVEEAGVHGDALELVYALYNKDVLEKSSTRDLKDINKALEANDLSKATMGDVRRAQTEIQSRIDELDDYRKELTRANTKLKRTPMPDFAGGLDDDASNDQFTEDYEQTTKTVERYTTAGLAAVKFGFSALEKYLDFLEQWEEFLDDDDTGGLVASGESSDKALEALKKKAAAVDRGGTLSTKIDPLVGSMAEAATDSPQLQTLVEDLKEQYPKSFLAVHLIEK